MEDLQRGHAQLERVDMTISVLFHIIRKSQQKHHLAKHDSLFGKYDCFRTKGQPVKFSNIRQDFLNFRKD